MKDVEIVEISTRVLERLSIMGDELGNDFSCEKMIFPKKENEDKDTHAKKKERRISEQELRFIFVDEFKKVHPDLYYSVETPTKSKYRFGVLFKDIKIDNTGKSGSIDMTIFDRADGEYKRDLNVEFKHTNVPTAHIAKDILKLVNEPPDGAFIHLLDNTFNDTLCNKVFNKFTEKEGTGVLNKLNESFKSYDEKWKGENDKQITIIIMSLKQKALIYRTIYIKKKGKEDYDKIFLKGICGNIKEIVDKGGWTTIFI